MEDTAVLSSFDKYTTFSFGGKTLTFRTCAGLENIVEDMHVHASDRKMTEAHSSKKLTSKDQSLRVVQKKRLTLLYWVTQIDIS